MTENQSRVLAAIKSGIGDIRDIVKVQKSAESGRPRRLKAATSSRIKAATQRRLKAAGFGTGRFALPECLGSETAWSLRHHLDLLTLEASIASEDIHATNSRSP